MLPHVLGCIAGDDTVLVITRSTEAAESLARRLLALAGRSRQADGGPRPTADPAGGPRPTSDPAGDRPADPPRTGETPDD